MSKSEVGRKSSSGDSSLYQVVDVQDRVKGGRDSRSFAGPQMSDNYVSDDDSAEEDELEDAMQTLQMSS